MRVHELVRLSIQLPHTQFTNPQDLEIDTEMDDAYPGMKVFVIDAVTGFLSMDGVCSLFRAVMPDGASDSPRGTYKPFRYKLFSRYSTDVYLNVLIHGYKNELHFGSLNAVEAYLTEVLNELPEDVSSALREMCDADTLEYARNSNLATNDYHYTAATLAESGDYEELPPEFATVRFNQYPFTWKYLRLGQSIFVPHFKDQQIQNGKTDALKSFNWIKETSLSQLEWHDGEVCYRDDRFFYFPMTNIDADVTGLIQEEGSICAFVDHSNAVRYLGGREYWWQFYRSKIPVVS